MFLEERAFFGEAPRGNQEAVDPDGVLSDCNRIHASITNGNKKVYKLDTISVHISFIKNIC